MGERRAFSLLENRLIVCNCENFVKFLTAISIELIAQASYFIILFRLPAFMEKNQLMLFLYSLLPTSPFPAPHPHSKQKGHGVKHPWPIFSILGMAGHRCPKGK
jgi:hypothetical protein